MPALSDKNLKDTVNVERLHALQASGSLEATEGLERNSDCVAVAARPPTVQAHPAGCTAQAGAMQACTPGGTACEQGPLQLTRHLAGSEQAASREREQHERALQQAQQAASREREQHERALRQAQQAASREREQHERALQQAQQAAVAARPLGAISRRASGVSVSASGEEGHAADKAAVATFQRQQSVGGTLVHQAAAGEGAAPRTPAVETNSQAAPVQAGSGADKPTSALDVQLLLEREGKTPLEVALQVPRSVPLVKQTALVSNARCWKLQRAQFDMGSHG